MRTANFVREAAMYPSIEPTAEQLIADLEALDDAIAAHLRTLLGSRRSISASELRRAIVDWCHSPEAREQCSAEALDGAAYALAIMEESLLLPLVRDLIRSDARHPTAA